MRNVTISAAVTIGTYQEVTEAAATHGVSVSTLIQLAVQRLLSLEPAVLAELCAHKGGQNG